MDILRSFNKRRTKQTDPADRRQVQNSAGGYAFTLDDAARLRRFLVLGVDGGTYYTAPRELAMDNVAVVARLAETDPRPWSTPSSRSRPAASLPSRTRRCSRWRTQRRSRSRLASRSPRCRRSRAPAPTCSCSRSTSSSSAAGAAGCAARSGSWYTAKDADSVAYQAVKYRQREGWSHRDLLRLAHPRTDVPELKDTFDWIVRGSWGRPPRGWSTGSCRPRRRPTWTRGPAWSASSGCRGRCCPTPRSASRRCGTPCSTGASRRPR